MNRDDKAEGLLAALLQDEMLFLQITSHIDKEIFPLNDYNNFYQELRRYAKQYRKKPSWDDFSIFTDIRNYIFAKDVFEKKAEVKREVVIDSFYKNYQVQQSLGLMERTAQRLETSAFDIAEVFDDTRKVVFSTKVPKVTYTVLTRETIKDKYLLARDYRVENTAPLVFKSVNKLLHGGIALEELAIFMAASNRGKTLYLVNELWQGMQHDEKCLYLSMENQDNPIHSRLFDRMLLMTKETQRRDEKFCIRFLEHVVGMVTWPAIVYVPANSFTVEDLDYMIEDLCMQSGVKFDRIIVDYMNKFKKRKSGKNSESWEDDRRLTDDLRAMAIEKKVRIITAAQTNRSAMQIGKVLGYSETPLEKQKGSGRIIILKVRESGGRGREFVVNTAPWVGLITDCVEELLPEDKRAILENPDIKVGQLPGLHMKKDKPEGKGKRGKDPEVVDINKRDDGPVTIDGVTL
jgi:KaiC/GvpD/RAD55 family RecA-like ATPase